MKKATLFFLFSLSLFSVSAQRPFPLGLPTCLEDDFRQLELLYDATNGSNWTNKSNWLTNPNMATWQGITLTPQGCDVQQIHLPENNLSGTLPMLNFPQLLAFRAWRNQLTGAIPNFNMPVLEQLYLDNNQLTGSVPNFNMSSLRYLVLWQNQLTGTIPNFNMPNLKELTLVNNQLTGTIPNFNMPILEYLHLGNNQLTGSIPNFNATTLKRLYLYINQLTGSIPNFNMPNLQILNLGENQLTGTIPNFNMPVLEEIYLNNNQLTGSVPNFNMPVLQQLYLHTNQLSGTLPNFNMPELKTLYFSRNQLTGIPNFNLPKLTKIYLNSNALSGTIPNFSNLPLLDTLFLQYNQLTGNIPNFNLPNLVSLSLRNNQLTGSVPDFNLPRLKQLRIDTNQLNGILPNLSNCNLLGNDAATQFRFDDNKFVFGDFEGKPWLNIANIKYNPQAKISMTVTNNVLSVNTGSANNMQQFQWYKDDVLVTTAQNNTFVPTSSGKYYCKVSHNTLTVPSNNNKNLVLQSEDYNLTVIPVELISFEVKNNGKTNELKWRTANEINTKRFEIERSADGKNFTTLNKVNPKGSNSDYTDWDNTPFSQITYYRLKIIDNDETFAYSNIVSAAYTNKTIARIYPSVTKGNLTVEGAYSFDIVSAFGQIIASEKSISPTYFNLNHLPNGIYLIKGVDTEGGIFAQKILKQ